MRLVNTDTEKQERQEEQNLLHFPLHDLLPEGQCLAVASDEEVALLLADGAPHPHMLGVQHNTDADLTRLLPQLHAFPYICPYEELCASFSHRHPTATHIAQWRKRLAQAAQEGVWDQEMRPVRNLLSRLRLKLRPFGIAVLNINETGYVLAAPPVMKRRQKGQLP